MEHVEHDPGATTPGGSEHAAATGEPRVDAALAQLGGLDNVPVAEHPAIFERVHGQLVEVLGELRADPDAARGRHGQD